MFDKSNDRSIVVSRLAEDLVGPHGEAEELSSRPSDVYLTGILWPQGIAMSGEDDERLGTAGTRSGDDADNEIDTVSTSSIKKPSVAGISFSVAAKEIPQVKITCMFASYFPEKRGNDSIWVRKPYEVIIPCLNLDVGPKNLISLKEYNFDVPEYILLCLRCIKADNDFLVTLTLMNTCTAEANRDSIEHSSLFQTKIMIEPCLGTFLIPKPPRQHAVTYQNINSDFDSVTVSDEEGGALLYRNVVEFAVGHVCSAEWEESAPQVDKKCLANWVATTWIPTSIVESIDPNGHELFTELSQTDDGFDPLSAESLSFANKDTLRKGLLNFCEIYKRWLQIQNNRVNDPDDVSVNLVYVAKAHLERCNEALRRMIESVDAICKDSRLRRAFQLANLAMHIQHSWDVSKSKFGSLRWRPFQLGFLLLSAPSAVDKTHRDRDTMDLLWFPTGGGKTEAYLALIACVAVYRRLSDDPNDHAGVSALMRYSLRLLTTQQFARSAAMIIALEALRSKRVPCPDGLELQGEQPFSIGLWVGGDATPNKRIQAFASLQGTPEIASPKQLDRCPCCGEKLSWSMASINTAVRVECINSSCLMKGNIPVFTVDEDIYDHRPTLLIGTIDKFAQIVRVKKVNSLFGILTGSTPDLIIQDELHLISGPLGTVAGIYEVALDIMFASLGNRAKVIGSTATIRQAPEQVRALFDRHAFQFPPPAIDHDDSGFAVRSRRTDSTGRRYVGITTAGRSAKFTLQAVTGSLLQTAFGAFSDDARRDAYWTLVGYFNSLRELGGALVLMQDDVKDSIKLYSESRDPKEPPRPLSNIEELTSRRTQEEIRGMLDLLDIKVGSPGAVDVVLATNMVSVGVDISRLGLMLVNGQPKTIAEYIQSTSRVGRGTVSGLIVSVLNNAKARDRSHFETFCCWHQTLYRDVEATSVTPFASRARDRALHAAFVATVRHLVPGMLESPRMDDDAEDNALDLIDMIVERASRIDPEEVSIRDELEYRLDAWRARSPESYWNEFKISKSLLQSAERAAASRLAGRQAGAAWPTLNSMRSVEAGTPFKLVTALKSEKDDTHG